MYKMIMASIVARYGYAHANTAMLYTALAAVYNC